MKGTFDPKPSDAVAAAPRNRSEPQPIYTDEQKMLALSFLSYVGFYEPTFGARASLRTLDGIKQGLAQSSYLTEWKVVWGPATYRLPLTIFDENLMFVVRSENNPSHYVIVIRGTNPLSISNWILQDFSVVRQVPWPYCRDQADCRPRLSSGTARGLQALQQMKPERGIPGAGKTLEQFLAREVRQTTRKLRLSVTGHSLGGALAPTLALWLHDTRKVPDRRGCVPWDREARADIEVFAFAGPSPGNRDFSRYFHDRLGHVTRRIWNRLDAVPHGWLPDALRTLPDIYKPDAAPLLPMALLLELTVWLAQHGNYEHVLPDAPALENSRVMPRLRDYMGQMIYQHTAAYPELLNVAAEIDTSVHFHLEDELKDIVDEARSQVPVELARAVVSGDKRELRPRAASRRTTARRAIRGLHMMYRVPASLVHAVLPKAMMLRKMKRRQETFHRAAAGRGHDGTKD